MLTNDGYFLPDFSPGEFPERLSLDYVKDNILSVTRPNKYIGNKDENGIEIKENDVLGYFDNSPHPNIKRFDVKTIVMYRKHDNEYKIFTRDFLSGTFIGLKKIPVVEKIPVATTPCSGFGCSIQGGFRKTMRKLKKKMRTKKRKIMKKKMTKRR